MKKIALLSILMLLSGISMANPMNHGHSSFTQEEMHLKLDLGDLEDIHNETIITKIEDFVQRVIPLVKNNLKCTITVKGGVKIGGVNFDISVEVSGDCEEVRRKISEIADQIIQDLKDEIRRRM